MRRRRGHAQAGYTAFSLIEISLVAGLALSIGATLTTFHMAITSGVTSITTQMTLSMGMNLTIDRILRDVRSAIETVDTRAVDGTTYRTDPGADGGPNPTWQETLILNVPSVASTGEVIDMTSAVDYIIYHFRQSGGILELRRIVNPDPRSRRTPENRRISDSLAGVTFQEDVGGGGNNTTVRIVLNGTHNDGGHAYRVDLSAVGVLRSIP